MTDKGSDCENNLKLSIDEENRLINDIDKPSDYQKIIKIGICFVGIVIAGSIQGIIVPLMTISVPSEYFLILFSSFEIFAILLLIMAYYCWKYDRAIFTVNEWSHVLTLFFAGFFSALMCVAKIYASNPELVSPIIQSTLVSSTILFSFIFSKLLLQKDTKYNYLFIIYSSVALLGSIIIPFVYSLLIDTVHGRFYWVLIYTFGVICRALFPVFQEKYFIQTNEYSTLNKIKLLFYVNMIQFFVVIPFYGLEYVIGNTDTPGLSMLNSLKILFSDIKAALIFQGFVASYFMFLGFSIYLNTISSNYIMIACAVITPLVMIFFIIFKNIMPGIIFPLYVVIPSLVLSVISAFLWIKGEKNH